MRWLVIVACVIGSLPVLFFLGYWIERLYYAWKFRHVRRAAPGEDFELPPGRVVRIEDTLWLSRDGDEVVARYFDEYRARIDALPLVAGQWEISLVAPGPVLRVEAWRGIRIAIARRDFSYEEATASDWREEEHAPHRPFPKLAVEVRYVLDTATLRESGAPASRLARSLLLCIVEVESGVAWPPHTPQHLDRMRFFHMTGIHPSWAEEPDWPARPEERTIAGSFKPDLGVVLERPARPLALTIFAAIGAYKSNEVRVTVRP
jgi:hypothetical protein